MMASSPLATSSQAEDSRDDSNGYLTPIMPRKHIVWEQAPLSPPITPSLAALVPYAK